MQKLENLGIIELLRRSVGNPRRSVGNPCCDVDLCQGVGYPHHSEAEVLKCWVPRGVVAVHSEQFVFFFFFVSEHLVFVHR